MRERGFFFCPKQFSWTFRGSLGAPRTLSVCMFSKLFTIDTELEDRQRKPLPSLPFSNNMPGWKMVFPIAVSQNFLRNGVCRRCSVTSLSRHGRSVIPIRWMDFFPAFVKMMLLCHSKWVEFLLFVTGELYLHGADPSTPLVLMGCWRHRCCLSASRSNTVGGEQEFS